VTRRHELTDDEWALVEPHLPPPSRGRAWADHRTVVSGVVFWASTGIQWRDLPDRFGPWQTVYERFRRWQREGRWLAILRALQGRADRDGILDWSLFAADSTNVRASRSAAGAVKKKGPGRPTRRWAAAAAGTGRSCT
jgi:transposase